MKSKGNAGSAARRERRDFSAEFKAEAVRLVAERRAGGDTPAQVGRELDVKPDQLRAWAKHERRESGSGGARAVESAEQELRRLRREVAVLRQEQAFAKKAPALFLGSRDPRVVARSPCSAGGPAPRAKAPAQHWSASPAARF